MELTAIIYSDLNVDTPTDQPLVYNLTSINQALEDLLSTRKGERIFNPEYGVDIEDELFELIDELSALDLFNRVTLAVKESLPVVKLDLASSNVTSNEDDNAYDLVLVYGVDGISGSKFQFSASVSI